MKIASIFAALLLGVSTSTAALDTTRTAHVYPNATVFPMPFDLEFAHGATVDFADVSLVEPGQLRGYVYVRMQGELVVIPVYRPSSGAHMSIPDDVVVIMDAPPLTR
jgi:hypothetical protein